MPASRAQLRLCDTICTRLGSDDDLESNASTFMVECRDISYIISHPSAKCLILIDELGRGTSLTCGLAFATAICEELTKTEV